MRRPLLLDLFCGAGGAGVGYQRAGFDVVGVDLIDQEAPFPVILGDATDPPVDLSRFDAVHASPPCQHYSSQTNDPSRHPDLYAPTRDLLVSTGLPWVIENVIGAPHSHGLILCGSMFGLGVRRHRNFETSHLFMQSLVCDHRGQGPIVDVTGHPSEKFGKFGGTKHPNKWRSLEHGRQAMGIDWMSKRDLPLAIPPAYTEFIGTQLLEVL